MSSHENLHAHLQTLVGERHPFSSPEKLRQVERYLGEQLRLVGLAVETHAFEAFGSTYHNVVGTLGAEPQTSPLIIAAHYDTVEGSPGADDNASGLAVLLDVARRLSGATLQRPVRFIAFCLEEEDLLGSLAYARYLREMNQPMLGAIVLECVGYACSEEGSQRVPPGVPVAVPSIGDFLAVVGNTASADLTSSVERATKPHVPAISLMVPGNGELLPDTRRSDHAAFWHYGYPAVMLTDTANFRNPHYHRAGDTLDTLNLAFMDKVTNGVTAAVIQLAGQKEREPAP
jgi:Zn-dependent M28 family amino/carboxypeptidase